MFETSWDLGMRNGNMSDDKPSDLPRDKVSVILLSPTTFTIIRENAIDAKPGA